MARICDITLEYNELGDQKASLGELRKIFNKTSQK